MRAVGLVLVLFAIVSCSCSRNGKQNNVSDAVLPDSVSQNAVSLDSVSQSAEARRLYARFSTVVANAELPGNLAASLKEAWRDSAFYADLQKILRGDIHLRELVDKQHPLSAAYAPPDLVALKSGSYRLGRAGLHLREAAAAALDEMAAAAAAGGVTLVASSAYRSYEYQEGVYSRAVAEIGQEAADRESARPGFSQHQTGLVLDFGSIDDSFATTAAGRWMAANASGFGWSLSYPDGYEAVTGYRWESWHYRYVGRELAAFIGSYFGGIQQYALRFLCEWELQNE